MGLGMDVPQDCWAACMVDGREEVVIGIVRGWYGVLTRIG